MVLAFLVFIIGLILSSILKSMWINTLVEIAFQEKYSFEIDEEKMDNLKEKAKDLRTASGLTFTIPFILLIINIFITSI